MANSARSNTSVTILASAASTGQTSAWIKNEGYKGGIFIFEVTAEGSTAAKPTFTIQGKVPGSTRAFNVAQVASTAGVPSVTTLVIYPGASTAGSRPAGAGGSTGAHDVWSVPLPYEFRVRGVSATTADVTFSAHASLIE